MSQKTNRQCLYLSVNGIQSLAVSILERKLERSAANFAAAQWNFLNFFCIGSMDLQRNNALFYKDIFYLWHFNCSFDAFRTCPEELSGVSGGVTTGNVRPFGVFWYLELSFSSPMFSCKKFRVSRTVKRSKPVRTRNHELTGLAGKEEVELSCCFTAR